MPNKGLNIFLGLKNMMFKMLVLRLGLIAKSLAW